MKREWVVPGILVLVTAGLSVYSLLRLPEMVVIQLSLNAAGNTAAPKGVAVLIPAALGVGGAVAAGLRTGDDNARGKGLIVSLVGVAVFLVMLAVNLWMK